MNRNEIGVLYLKFCVTYVLQNVLINLKILYYINIIINIIYNINNVKNFQKHNIFSEGCSLRLSNLILLFSYSLP